MSRSRLFTALLLAGTGLSSQHALAQDAPPTQTPTTGEEVAQPAPADPAESSEPDVEVSTPGGEGAEIVVKGQYIPEPVRNTAQVVSVISAAEIARTGDGDISGALQRVTGLSVNNNGFVYVRGLGERYSLALLNGLALPSPEPLRRVVPLDLFPTSIVSSALVQKSYSVNFPGEYGGGVINLTTAALPNESYLTLGAGVSGDTETTGQLGYTYYGSGSDLFGFDDGTRMLPARVRENNGALISAAELENEDTLILQRNRKIPVNVSASASGGYVTDWGDTRFGVIANLSFSNAWKTRGATQQTATGGSLINSSYGVRTENRIQLSALLGLGLDLPQGHKLRFTNVFIRDTSKVARVRGSFDNIQTAFEDLDPSRFAGPYTSLNYESNYVQRQLLTSQLVGEFEFGDIEVDLRGSYSNSKRQSPYERSTQYRYNSVTTGYVANLAAPSGVNFSYLNEDVWAGGADISYEMTGGLTGKISAGYAFSDTARRFEALNFAYDDGGLPIGASGNGYLPIYLILSPAVIAAEGISLRQSNRAFGQSLYRGDLTVHGGYVRGDFEIVDGLRLEAGVRYEHGVQTLTLPDVYGNNTIGGIGNAAVIEKKNGYWLPAATVTWNFAEDFQLRLHGSKTIARPQFRELGTIPVLDVESDRQLGGNPFLTDSQLYNAEARIEYYPGRGERMSLAGFYKRINNPIESVASIDASGQLQITNANAPKADLYGVEAEVVKYFDLSGLGGFFDTRRLLVSANYTYSKSKIMLSAGDTTILYGGNVNFPIVAPANQVFTAGSALTGQSEHLVNLQLGIEDTERLSQLTALLTYASPRVTSRGASAGGIVDPDIIERPGVNLDLVLRQGIAIKNWPEIELKLEGRNLLGTEYRETQSFAGYTVLNNVYDVGRSFSGSLSVKF